MNRDLVKDSNYQDSNYDGRDCLEGFKPVCPDCLYKDEDGSVYYDPHLGKKPNLEMLDYAFNRYGLREDPIWGCPECGKTFKGRTSNMQYVIQNSNSGSYDSRGPESVSALLDKVRNDEISSAPVVTVSDGTQMAASQLEVDDIRTKSTTSQSDINLIKGDVRELQERLKRFTEDPVACLKLKIMSWKLKY